MTVLPPGVERLEHGGLRVGDRPGWRWLPRALAVVCGLLGLGALGFGLLLRALDAPGSGPALIGGVVLLIGIPMALRIGRSWQGQYWIVDADGLHVHGGAGVEPVSVPWARVAALELHDRRTRLPIRGGSGGYTRLVSVAALDPDGVRLLRLPDENSPDRVHAVFDAARRGQLVPPHVRFVART